MDYRQVGLLFDMLAEYFHNKPPPEERDARGEWVRVRDGLQGAEHCIRVLTPDEFDEWHRCIGVPIQVEYGRQPVAFCSHEGRWWVIYEDTEESEVIVRSKNASKVRQTPTRWATSHGSQIAAKYRAAGPRTPVACRSWDARLPAAARVRRCRRQTATDFRTSDRPSRGGHDGPVAAGSDAFDPSRALPRSTNCPE